MLTIVPCCYCCNYLDYFFRMRMFFTYIKMSYQKLLQISFVLHPILLLRDLLEVIREGLAVR